MTWTNPCIFGDLTFHPIGGACCNCIKVAEPGPSLGLGWEYDDIICKYPYRGGEVH